MIGAWVSASVLCLLQYRHQERLRKGHLRCGFIQWRRSRLASNECILYVVH